MSLLAHLPWTVGLLAGTIDVAEGQTHSTQLTSVLTVVAAIAGLLLFVAAALGVLRWMRRKKAAGGPAAVNVVSKESRKRIEAAVEEGDYETAGDLLLRAGANEDAAEAYAQARAYLKAAKAYHSTNCRSQAIWFYRQAGEVGQAARLYSDAGDWMAAAAEYLEGGDHRGAAQAYAAAGDSRRAAENYERGGDRLKAGEYFENAGVVTRAAENFASHFDDVLSRASGDIETVEGDRQFALRAGELFRQAGEMQRASTIFQQAGYWEEAAACMRTTGNYSRAAEMLMQAKRPELAAEVLEEAGEQVKAFRMRAEAALASGDRARAAAMLRDAGETDRAASLFEEEGMASEAAELYEKLGMQARAMQLYVEAERWAYAARCAEMLGDQHKASEYFKQAGDVDGELRALVALGDYFRAGRLQFEHRRYDEALTTLQNIDSRDAIFPRSLELQGDVLRAQNRFEKAYSKYRAALGNREMEEATLPLHYKMARALEDEEDFAGSLDLYKRILEVNKNHEDVGLRVKAVRGRLKRGSLPGVGVTSSGIFSSPEGADGRRYEIVDEIARGGMGIVYKARDTVLGRIVAYKILGENLRDNETAVKYFLREARAAAALSHPNIVTIYDAGEQDGDYYMAMEYVEGTTLKELIRRKGGLPEEQVRFILIHCCRALQYAHSKGIIHRDIKSGNVMITRDKALKIMDFGLAKFIREYQKDHTQQVGTPFYMSPEQIIGKDIDFRSDLYSLGCTVYECATGTVPFFKGDLSYHHVHTKPPSPRSINPALTRDLERVILQMLEKKPDDRYQSAKDIIEGVTAGAATSS